MVWLELQSDFQHLNSSQEGSCSVLVINNISTVSQGVRRDASSSSSSGGHEVRPINDLFRPHDFVCLIGSSSSSSSSSSSYDRSIVKELFWVYHFYLDCANFLSSGSTLIN
jgi:hypothetical protein